MGSPTDDPHMVCRSCEAKAKGPTKGSIEKTRLPGLMYYHIPAPHPLYEKHPPISRGLQTFKR
jgi:hypothetical protein